MKAAFALVLLLSGLLPACAARPVDVPVVETAASPPETEKGDAAQIVLTFGAYSYTVTLEDNETAEAFAALLTEGPVIVNAHDYSGFEKVGLLDAALPRNDVQTTTSPGDFVLYSGDQLVLFYGSNSWSYTRLGRLDDPSGLREALGDGDVALTFSLLENQP